MNRCCSKPGNAQIVESQNPEIMWRVVCLFCGLTLHEQKEGQ
jgi:hypothetical protein